MATNRSSLKKNKITSTELDAIVALSCKMIAIQSDPDNRKALNEILTLTLAELRGFTVERFEKNGSKSALIYTGKKRPAKFKVMLNGHLDVIPGKPHQYTPVVKNGRIYGVGSMDMKSNVACLIAAFKRTARGVDYPLGLQIVTDEEIGGFDGTKHQVDEGVLADFVIAGETTNFDIVNEAKGIIWAKVHCKGKTAHGAYPWRGKNAIWAMNTFLNQLKKRFPVPTGHVWRTTVNLAKLETTNDTFNKIPDTCSAWLDIRYVHTDARKVLAGIRSLLPAGFQLEVIASEPALFTEKSNTYIKSLQSSVQRITGKPAAFYGAQGSSDARHFTRVGCSGIEFGPIGGGIGTDNEWVRIKSLGDYVAILEDFLLALD